MNPKEKLLRDWEARQRVENDEARAEHRTDALILRGLGCLLLAVLWATVGLVACWAFGGCR